MADKDSLVEEIKAALVDLLKTGSSAPKVYLRVRPDGTVDTTYTYRFVNDDGDEVTLWYPSRTAMR